jgi:hypothetical protein
MNQLTQQADQIAQKLEPYFTTQAPWQLPEAWRQSIVRWAPWAVLVVFILTLPLVLAALGISTFLGVFIPIIGIGVLIYWIAIITLLIQEVLLIASFQGLKNRTISGWNIAFYASLLNAMYGVFTWLTHPWNIGSLISVAISAAITWYILFQVRAYYTGKKHLVTLTTKPAPAQ